MANTQGTHSVIQEPATRDRNQQVEVWRVASIKHNGVGLLFSIPVRDDETGKDVMERLRRQFGACAIKQCLNMMFLFRRQAIFISKISLASYPYVAIQQLTDVVLLQSSIAALESQIPGVPVNVDVVKLDPLLTEAFHDPYTLALWKDFGSANRRFANSGLARNPFSAPQALTVGWVTTKSYLVWLILVLCLASLAAGVVVGKLCHNAGLGLAVTGVVAAVLSIVEILMLLQLNNTFPGRSPNTP